MHEDVRNQVIQEFHCPSHFYTEKNYSLMIPHVYWKGLYDDVRRYCTTCFQCQANKKPNSLPAGTLEPHDITDYCWHTVTMDFLTELHTTENGFDAIFVIVDKISKRAILVATMKTINAQDAAILLQDFVFSKHGVCRRIICDRDPKFRLHFWCGLMRIIQIKLNMSTISHPQTDGQSENTIRTLSNMLRNSSQQLSNDWARLLSIFEFEYYSSKLLSTGLAPFEVDLGLIPQGPSARKFSIAEIPFQRARDHCEMLSVFQKIAKDNLAYAGARQQFYAYRTRDVSVSFLESDLVMLSTERLDRFTLLNLPTKWRPKFLHPLRVSKVMGPVTYQIELPPKMWRVPKFFHVSKLKAFYRSNSRSNPLPITIDADGEIGHEVERILDKKKGKSDIVLSCSIRWGEPECEATWIRNSELRHGRKIIREYEDATRTPLSKFW